MIAISDWLLLQYASQNTDSSTDYWYSMLHRILTAVLITATVCLAEYWHQHWLLLQYASQNTNSSTDSCYSMPHWFLTAVLITATVCLAEYYQQQYWLLLQYASQNTNSSTDSCYSMPCRILTAVLITATVCLAEVLITATVCLAEYWHQHWLLPQYASQNTTNSSWLLLQSLAGFSLFFWNLVQYFWTPDRW